MWLALIGPPGSCKQAVADRIAKDMGFVVERETLPTEALAAFEQSPSKEAFGLQLDWMIRRWRLQRNIQRRGAEEDVVQVRTFWDTEHIFTEVLYFRGYIGDKEHEHLRLVYNALSETLTPPHIVIYLRSSSHIAENRISVSGKKSLHEEDSRQIVEMYEAYAKKIRVSVVEVDVVEDFELMISEVKAAIEGVRASGMMNQSIWSRGFLK